MHYRFVFVRGSFQGNIARLFSDAHITILLFRPHASSAMLQITCSGKGRPGYNAEQSVESQSTIRRNVSPQFPQPNNKAKQKPA
jgi:hypothetical protein